MDAKTMPISPLAPLPIERALASLPKADLHLHQEGRARLDRFLARKEGREPYDWQPLAREVLHSSIQGMDRLVAIYSGDVVLAENGVTDDLDANPENFIGRVVDLLEEGAADGALLIEVRFGAGFSGGLSQPEFMPLFREAERRARHKYPRLRAEAIAFLNPANDPARLAETERQLEVCLRAREEGLAGIDFRVDPYETEADPALWQSAYRVAERAADVGLGVTVHTGEFSLANVAAALEMPGLSRIGHGVHAAYDERLLERIAEKGITVECSLTCNVVLGAARSYEEHPIRRFVEYGIPVTLNTDLPVHVCTTIGREYAVASALGFSTEELLGFTRSSFRASFTSEERRVGLLRELDAWVGQQPHVTLRI